MDHLDSLRAVLRLSWVQETRAFAQRGSRQSRLFQSPGHGTTNRSRSVHRQAANGGLACGNLPLGPEMDSQGLRDLVDAASPRSEVKSCTNFCMDCKLSDWSEWSICTRSANLEGWVRVSVALQGARGLVFFVPWIARSCAGGSRSRTRNEAARLAQITLPSGSLPTASFGSHCPSRAALNIRPRSS